MACTAHVPLLSPSTITTNPTSGASASGAIVALTIDCSAGETYSIAATAASTSAIVGSGPGQVEGVWFKDASLTQPLYGAAINGTAAATGPITTSLYARVGGPSGGVFQGVGTYSIAMGVIVTSCGNGPIAFSLQQNGTVNGTCSINNASVDFGNVVSGTKPIRPVGIILNCSAGMAWSMSQPAVANITVGVVGGKTAWLYAGAGGTAPLYSAPILGNGSGSNQTVSAYSGIAGATEGSAVSGAGVIVGTIPVTVSY
jgi:hypothetical protein